MAYTLVYTCPGRREPRRQLCWVGSSLEDVRGFSAKVRRIIGFELDAVQRGMEPADWKPMTSVGLGVREIRIHVAGEHRVLYLTRFDEAVYVLHAFEKKSQRTAKKDLALAEARYRLALHRHLRRKEES
jgi:phage-related protein